jgi:hypothetical protein
MTTPHSTHDDHLIQENDDAAVEENDDAVQENDDFFREGTVVEGTVSQDPDEPAADSAAEADPDVLILVPEQDSAGTASEPAAETIPDPVTEDTPETIAGTTPDPLLGDTSGTVAETTSDPVFGDTSGTAAETTPDPLVGDTSGTVAETTSDPVFGDTSGTAAETVPDPVAEDIPATAARPGALAADPPPAIQDSRWREIQAMFVDDPRGSVERAADLASETLRELSSQLEQREQTLRSGWQDNSADTEGLRTSLQGYRALIGQISELVQQP